MWTIFRILESQDGEFGGIVFRTTTLKVFIFIVITFLSFTKLSYANLADEYFNKSVVFFSNGDINKGSIWLKKAAVEGNDKYQYYLGNYYQELKIKIEDLDKKEAVEWRKEAFKWYLKSAKNGNAFAQYEIGTKYYEWENYEQAMYWLMKSFDGNSLQYLSKIFTRIEANKITSESIKLKMNNIKKLAEEGSAKDQLLYYLFGGTSLRTLTSTQYRLIKDSAEQGLPTAMFGYAKLAKKGIKHLGIPKDKDKALLWIKKASKHGLAEAEYEMAEIFEKGEFVTQDNQKAFKLYKSAANKGISEAQRKIAKIYFNGLLGIKKDVSLAINWFVEEDLNQSYVYFGFIKNSYIIRLAKQGDRKAQSHYSHLLQRDDLPYIEQDKNKAMEWNVKSANQGYINAINKLCIEFSDEGGEFQDHQKAFKWCRKAANFGEPLYYFILAEMYKKGQGVIQDYKEAFKWYLKSAKKQGLGQFQVARMYADGQGVEQNYSESIKWYKKEGGSSSFNNIGVMYEYGNGVIKDKVTAHLYYNISGAKGGEKGRENRDRISKKMTREEIVEAQRLAREWMKKNESE